MADISVNRFFFILIAGMGNLKHGNWKSILIYFSFMLLLGCGLSYLIHSVISPYYHLQSTWKIFLVLVYLIVTFFWDGSFLLRRYQQARTNPRSQ
jgi:ABC-type polysaccharide/polyol phosphate export permease